MPDKKSGSTKTQVTGKASAASLAALLDDGDFEAARAAKRELKKRTLHAGRPGAEAERAALIQALLPFLKGRQPAAVKREVLWLLAEIGGDETVPTVAALLADKTLREDARMVLDHIPGQKSFDALQAALATVPEDFKINIAQSLRHRGILVAGHPCQKLVPTRKTNVKPL